MRHGDRTLGRALLALVVPFLVGCGGSDGGDPGSAPTTEAGSVGVTLITPDTAGEWSRVTTDAAQDNAEAYLVRANESAEPGTTPLFAEYERDDGGTMAFLGLNVAPESAYGRRLADAPEVVVDVTLAPTRASRTARRWTPGSSAALWRAGPCRRSSRSTV